jgi:hypothetical protein
MHMNLDTNDQRDTTIAIERLIQAAERIRSNGKTPYKGVTKIMKQQWSEQIAVLFSDPHFDLERIVDDLANLPGDAVAEGVARAWNRMDRERREVYRRWLKSLHAEKEASQKIPLVCNLLEVDSAAALEFLCEVPSKNRENAKRIITALLSQGPEQIQLLFSNATSAHYIRKGIDNLLTVIDHESVDHRTRWLVLKAGLSILSERHLQSDTESSNLLDRIGKFIAGLEPPNRDGILAELRKSDPSFLQRLFPDEAAEQPPSTVYSTGPDKPVPLDSIPPIAPHEGIAAPPQRLPKAPTVPASIMPKPAAISPRVLTSELLAEWVDDLRKKAELLEGLRSALDSSQEETLRKELESARAAQQEARVAAQEAKLAAEAAENSLSETKKLLCNAETHTREIDKRLLTLEEELAQAHEREGALKTEKQSSETAFLKEREELRARVRANADMRLSEFQEGLASTLRAILSRVPGRNSHVSAELGGVLLLRLHEVMDTLEAKGISIRSPK